MSEEQAAQGEAAAAEATEGSLLDSILAETKITPSDDGYAVAKAGVQALISELITPKYKNEKIDKALVDALIGEIDAKLSAQVDEIVHAAEFQKLESAWRGLKFTIDRTNFRENIKVEILNCSKADLMEDFEDAPEITKSGLYRFAYTAEYGQFGGKPYGAMFANWDISPGPQDMALLA
ncbi:MAG: type VI secretion system contractile sheath large subunit, partial [Polyangiaceae bacterium]